MQRQRSALSSTSASLLGLALAAVLLAALMLTGWDPAKAQTGGTPTGTVTTTSTAQQTTTPAAPTVAATGTGLAEAEDPDSGLFVLVGGGILVMVVSLALLGSSRNPTR